MCHWSLWQSSCQGLSIFQWAWGLDNERGLNKEGAMTDETRGGWREWTGSDRDWSERRRQIDTAKRMVCWSILGVRLHVIYKNCENPFQTLSNTNHHSVDSCQQHQELPFLFQTCGMCRDQHFRREITLHITIHYASSLPDCPHKSPKHRIKENHYLFRCEMMEATFLHYLPRVFLCLYLLFGEAG